MQVSEKENIVYGFTDNLFAGVEPEADINQIIKDLDLSVNQAIYLNQVHGDGIVDVCDGDDGVFCFEGDALVTSLSDAMLVVRTADCYPIFLYDGQKIAVVHAGWQSALKNILRKTIGFFENPAEIKMFIGPGLEKDCFEVKEDFMQNLGVLPHIEQKNGTFYFDLQDFLIKEAQGSGVLLENVESANICTFCAANLYSYRNGDLKPRIYSFISMKSFS